VISWGIISLIMLLSLVAMGMNWRKTEAPTSRAT
jgi:hypothetical protein